MIGPRQLVSIILTVCLPFIAAAGLPPPSPPESLVTVQVSAERMDQPGSKPASLRAEVEGLGFGPYWEFDANEGSEGTWRYGLVGKLDSLTEATVLKDQLKDAGFAEAQVRDFPSLVTSEFEPEVQSPVPPIFSLQMHSYGDKSTAMTPGMRDGLSAPRSLEDAELDEIADLFPTLDLPMKEKKRLACALARELTRRLSLSHNMLHSPASGDARAVIEDRIFPIILPAASDDEPDEFTLEARWIAATLWHEYLQDRIAAYRAFRQIVKEHGGDDPAVRARGLTTLAAVLMELAPAKMATMEESKRIACMVHASVPKEYEFARATAELIYWQAYFHTGDRETVLEGLSDFSARYPGALRETSGALWAVANAHGALGNNEEALDALKALLVLPLATSDIYHWAGRRNNVQLNAVAMLRHLSSREGVRLDSSMEDLYGALLDRPPADESFSPVFLLERLERTAAPPHEETRPSREVPLKSPVSGPAALEQPNTPEIGLIRAPLR